MCQKSKFCYAPSPSSIFDDAVQKVFLETLWTVTKDQEREVVYQKKNTFDTSLNILNRPNVIVVL